MRLDLWGRRSGSRTGRGIKVVWKRGFAPLDGAEPRHHTKLVTTQTPRRSLSPHELPRHRRVLPILGQQADAVYSRNPRDRDHVRHILEVNVVVGFDVGDAFDADRVDIPQTFAQ